MTDRRHLATIMESGSGHITVVVPHPFPIPPRNMRFEQQLKEYGPQWESLNEELQNLVRALMIVYVSHIRIFTSEDSENAHCITEVHWKDRRIDYNQVAWALARSLDIHGFGASVMPVFEPERMRMQPDRKLVFMDPFDEAKRRLIQDLVFTIDPPVHGLSDVEGRRSAWVASIAALFRPQHYRILVVEGELRLELLDPNEVADCISYVTVSPGTRMSSLIAMCALDPDLLARILELADLKE